MNYIFLGWWRYPHQKRRENLCIMRCCAHDAVFPPFLEWINPSTQKYNSDSLIQDFIKSYDFKRFKKVPTEYRYIAYRKKVTLWVTVFCNASENAWYRQLFDDISTSFFRGTYIEIASPRWRRLFPFLTNQIQFNYFDISVSSIINDGPYKHG